MRTGIDSNWRNLRWSFLVLSLLLLPVLSGRGAEPEIESAAPRELRDLFFEPDQVEAVFFLILSGEPRTESLEVAIPSLASGFISAEDAQREAAELIALKVLFRRGSREAVAASSVTGEWSPRSRTGNCRLAIRVAGLSVNEPHGTLMLLGRRSRKSDLKTPAVECHLLSSDGGAAHIVLSYFGLTAGDSRPGIFGMDSEWNQERKPAKSEGLQKFLKKFDAVSASGFTHTLRSGSTGIGYTLETLLGIEENNSPRGDFLGIELKAHRGDDLSASSSKKMNLFLKEPQWTDGLSHKERIPKYGYVDDNGRTALYSTVTSQENSHGLKLRPDINSVQLHYRGKNVAAWEHEVLEERLQEKLKETIFVGANTRGSGSTEEFHFQAVLYCREPSAARLAHLIATREAMVEMRMHIQESGSARNHGTAFRIRQNSLPQLYRTIVLCRTGRDH